MFITKTWNEAVQFAASYNDSKDRVIVVVGTDRHDAFTRLCYLKGYLQMQHSRIVTKEFGDSFVVPRTVVQAVSATENALDGMEPTLILFEMREDMNAHDMMLAGKKHFPLLCVIPDGISRDYLDMCLPPNPITV